MTMSEAEVNYYKKKFNALTHGHGITADILKELYNVAQIEVSDEEIQAQIHSVDTKGHNKVEIEDFLSAMNKQHELDSEKSISKVFKLIDTDNDGQINGEDLQRGATLFGNSLSKEEAKEMLSSADIDGDGLINYEEFLKIMTPSKVNGQTNL
ncbi:hypothetical protein G6F56_000271 [Rhizopus delemar]|nr:hypothetical protein G6F56_000271 [Rhizopus delemar]